MKKMCVSLKSRLNLEKQTIFTEKSPLIIQEFMRDIQHVFG